MSSTLHCHVVVGHVVYGRGRPYGDVQVVSRVLPSHLSPAPALHLPDLAYRTDAFETIIEILRLRKEHPGVPPERYIEVDERWRTFVNCELGKRSCHCCPSTAQPKPSAAPTRIAACEYTNRTLAVFRATSLPGTSCAHDECHLL